MSGAESAQDRWSSPQGNVTGLGIVASYSLRFWSLVIGLGLVAGLSAGLLVLLLRLVERLTFGDKHRYSIIAMAAAAPDWRRITALMAASLILLAGLWALRNHDSESTDVPDALWLRSGKLALFPSLARGLLSIVTVGMGVSLGREAAPQLFGAAVASRVAEWAELPLWQRRLLVASGAGAGFGAVYNVPLGGSLFALEVLLGTIALPLVLPAVLMAVTATAVTWIFLGHGVIYQVAADRFSPSQLVFAVIMGPVIGLVATGWTRVISVAHRHRPHGLWRWLAPPAAFGALGLLSLQYPQLLGNGRGLAQLAIVGNLSLGLLVVLLILKPIVTTACLASGAPGGLFTPTFAFGVLLAGAAGAAWGHVWHGSVPGAYALIGGGAFLAAAMQGPLSGVVLIVELTGHLNSLVVPTLISVVEATVLSRKLGAASIYSARLGPDAALQASPTAHAASAATIEALDGGLPPALTPTPAPPATEHPSPR